MIVAGFGFRSGASQASFADALQATGVETVCAFATLVDKTADLQPFADAQGKQLIAVRADDAERQATLTHSVASQAARNLGSVAEATALSAAGKNARLLAPRVVSKDKTVTCAVAEGDNP